MQSMKTATYFQVILFFALSNIDLTHAQWAQTNGPYGGNILSFAISGTNLFVGTDDGIFISTNSGTNWTAANTGLTNTDVNSLAASDADIFAGTKYDFGTSAQRTTRRHLFAAVSLAPIR